MKNRHAAYLIAAAILIFAAFLLHSSPKEQEFVWASPAETAVQQAEDKINLNTASKEELRLLPGIGEVRADNIVKYREENGGFCCIEEITDVDAVGKALFEEFSDKITI